MNHTRCTRLFQRATHGSSLRDITSHKPNACDLLRIHDRAQPARIFAAIENDHIVATLDESLDDPRPDATLRSGDEVFFSHLIQQVQSSRVFAKYQLAMFLAYDLLKGFQHASIRSS